MVDNPANPQDPKADLTTLFKKQLDRIQNNLKTPKPHASGTKKPSLAQQELKKK